MGCAGPQSPQRTIDLSHPMTDGLTLLLEYGEGTVTLREGKPGKLEVSGSLRRPGGDGSPTDAPLTFIQDGDTLRLAPSPGLALSGISYDITLPPGSDVEIKALKGTLQAEGLSGDLTIALHRGEIDLRGGRGRSQISLGKGELSAIDVGHLEVHALDALVYVEGLTEGGELEVNHGALSLVEGAGSITARVESGSLRVETTGSVGDLHLLSGEATVDVYLPSQGHFDLMAASVSGDLWVDHPALPNGRFPDGLTTSTGSLGDERIEILSAAGPINIYHIDPIPTFTAQSTYNTAPTYLP